MAYAVYLDVPNDLVDQVCESLKSPVWPIFLGRKCCVPSEIIFQGTFSNKDMCVDRAKEIASLKGRYCDYSVLQENSIDKGDVLVLNDVPVQFGIRKLYTERYVTVVKNPYEIDIS